MVANARGGVAKCIGNPILSTNCPIFDGNHFLEPLGDQMAIKIGTQLHMAIIGPPPQLAPSNAVSAVGGVGRRGQRRTA